MLGYITFLPSLFKCPVSFDYGYLNIKVPHGRENVQIGNIIRRNFSNSVFNSTIFLNALWYTLTIG